MTKVLRPFSVIMVSDNQSVEKWLKLPKDKNKYILTMGERVQAPVSMGVG